MCHWPSANVGHYLEDWETLGICNRQQSLSSITHGFNQLRSAAAKTITWHVCDSIRVHVVFVVTQKNPITSKPNPAGLTHLRMWTILPQSERPRKWSSWGIKSLHSWSQDKPCEVSLPQTYGSSLDTLGSSNLGAALLVARAVLAGVSSVVSLVFNGDKFSFIQLSRMQIMH